MNKVDKKTTSPFENKRCSSCKSVKTFEFFYKNKSTKDGLGHECKSCVSDHASRIRQGRTQKKIAGKLATVAAQTASGKTCFRCGCVKQLSAFNTDRSKPGGVVASCKDCMRASRAVANAKYKKANPEKVRALVQRHMKLFKHEYAKVRRLKIKRECMALSDAYVAKLLTRYTSALKPSALPKALIEAKRLELLISRYLKEEI